MAARTDSSPKGVISAAGPHDVLLGRGGGTNNHSGNKNFRELVNKHKRRYLACSKVDKPKVAREVVEIWRGLNPPGRFLQRLNGPKADPQSFQEVTERKAREKASQCLRERTPDVLPYLSQYHQEQDQITEEGVGMVHLKMQMTGKSDAPTPVAEIPEQPVSSNGAQSQPMVRRSVSPIAPSLQEHHGQKDMELHHLYNRQQQVLREAYSSDNPQKAHQDAIHMAHQRALQERNILEQQRHMLMQQQLAMQKQMLQNNILAQQLMLHQNGLAMAAAGMPSPMASPSARRQSLSTGFSRMGLHPSAVSPSPHTPQSGVHPMAHHVMASNIPAPPLDVGGTAPLSYAPIPAQIKSGDGVIPVSLSNENQRLDVATGGGLSPLAAGNGRKPSPLTPSSRKGPTVPRVIDTKASQEEAANFLKLPLDGTPKHNNPGESNANTGHLGDAGSALKDYTTNLNDLEDDHEFPDPNMYFDDDSSEELLKDHSKFHDSLNSGGSSEFSLTRKKKGMARRSSRSSGMSAMSLGTSSLMSLSAMEYSADLTREQKMSAARSHGSNRSIMSELTDYEQLHL